MIGTAKTEVEQVAFFDAVLECFKRAVERVGEIRHHYRVAGLTVRLSLAGDAFEPALTRAIGHREIGPVASPDVTLCAWDSHETGVTMVPPPCDRLAFSDRGDLWGFNSQRVRTSFQHHDHSVNVYDADRRTGLYWVQRAALLPHWSHASPLRTMWHWALERHGLQLVHGAAIGGKDGALLIVGKGGSGKSSTALTCLEAGLDVAGDDYVVVRHNPEPRVHGLYSTAKLNPADLARYPRLAPLRNKVNVPANEKAVLFLDPQLSGQLPPDMPLAGIALAAVVDREGSQLVAESLPVVQQAATFTTMSQLPYASGRTHRFLESLCAALPTYRLELGRDPVRLAETVRRFLGDRARPRPRPAAAPLPDTPLVSVIIPVYNGESFLAEAMASVLGQGYPALEVIVVDDGSTDATAAVARRLPCDVRLFKQANAGPAAARNRGIRNASADFVAFLDVDDLWPPGTLSMLMSELLRDPELELCQGYAQVTEFDPATGEYEYRGNPRESFPYSVDSAIFRTRVFDRVGLFDQTLLFGEDTDWFKRAEELAVPIKRVEAVTLLVRRHGQNMTHGREPVGLHKLRVLKRALDRKRANVAKL